MTEGVIELDCDKPVVRNASGRLPYDIKLRAQEVKKKKAESFSEAAAESFGSGSSAGSKHSRSSVPRSEEIRSTGPKQPPGREDEDEVLRLFSRFTAWGQAVANRGGDVTLRAKAPGEGVKSKRPMKPNPQFVGLD